MRLMMGITMMKKMGSSLIPMADARKNPYRTGNIHENTPIPMLVATPLRLRRKIPQPVKKSS
jgi:hypothetical protein